MTLQDALLSPDKDILKSGEMVMLIVREWARLTGEEPDACDCKFKYYLSYVRQDIKTRNTVYNDIYYDGRYYDRTTITENEKAQILAKDERLYIRLFGQLPVEPSKAEPTITVKKPAKNAKK